MKSEGERTLIFDIFRNRWVALTPEEWVRQHMARYLADGLGYPSSLILLEGAVMVNGMNRRCDILVYDREGRPLMIGECKAPEVKVSQRTFDQVARYNLALGVRLLLITNGLEHYCMSLDAETGSYSFLAEIPQFGSLASQSSRRI